MLLAAGGTFAILTAAPLSIAAFMGVEPSTLAGVSSAKSFLAMLTDRSPGDRTAGALTTKQRRAQAAAGPARPHERALGKIQRPETPKEFLQALAPPPPTLAELPPLQTALTNLGPLLAIPQPPGTGGILAPAQTPPGGGGGGGGGGGVDTPTPTPPNDVPAIPEPSTWATMLLGFAMVGWQSRRRRTGTAPSRA